MGDVNEGRKGETPLDEPLKCLSVSSDQRPSSSAFKLGDERDKIPSHFRVLVNNTIADRWKLIEMKRLDAMDFFLECDLFCCAVLTIALEEGLRVDELHNTSGFDIMALRDIEHMPRFRSVNKTYKLMMTFPQFPDMQFTAIIIPFGNKISTLNVISFGKDKDGQATDIVAMSSTGVPISNYIEAMDSCSAKIVNLASLSNTVRPVIEAVKRQVALKKDRPLPNALLSLPEELIFHVLKFLPVKDFLALSSTNQYLHSFASNEELWRHFLKRDFNQKVPLESLEHEGPCTFRDSYVKWVKRHRMKSGAAQTVSFWHNAATATSERMSAPSSSRPMRSISEMSGSEISNANSYRSAPRSEWEF